MSRCGSSQFLTQLVRRQDNTARSTRTCARARLASRPIVAHRLDFPEVDLAAFAIRIEPRLVYKSADVRKFGLMTKKPV